MFRANRSAFIEWGRLHPLAKSRSKFGKTRQIIPKPDGDPDELLRRLRNQLGHPQIG